MRDLIKNWKLWSVLTLVVILGTLTVLPEVTARPTCTTPAQSTAVVTGQGGDCASAYQDAVAKAAALINCPEGVCSQGFFEDQGCYAEENGYCLVDGHYTYHCNDME